MSLTPTPDGATSANAEQHNALEALVSEMIGARLTRDRIPSDHADGVVYGTFRSLRAVVESIESSRLPEPDLMGVARDLLTDEGQP